MTKLIGRGGGDQENIPPGKTDFVDKNSFKKILFIEIICIIDLGYFRDILKLGQIGHGDSLPLGNRKHSERDCKRPSRQRWQWYPLILYLINNGKDLFSNFQLLILIIPRCFPAVQKCASHF